MPLEWSSKQLEWERKRLERREREAWERALARLDRATLERIERRFGAYIPKERLERVRREAPPPHFLKERDYQRHLHTHREPLQPEPGEKILGDYHERSREIYLNRDHPLLPLTLAHERLHQLRDPRFHVLFGPRLEEGLTEHLARQVYTDPEIQSLGDSYPRERRLITMLAARVGEDLLKRAYFRGEWHPLQERVDRELGPGALAEVARLSREGRYEEAERILRRR